MAIRAELLELSSEERQELADDLYESIAGENVDPAWGAASVDSPHRPRASPSRSALSRSAARSHAG
jgi:hypothetical protein